MVTKNGCSRQTQKRKQTKHQQRTTSIDLPYIRGLSEKLTPIFQQHGIGTYHKPFNIVRSLLVHPKDKTKNDQKWHVIYKISCSDYDETYIREKGRTLGCRMREHASQREPTTAGGEHISMKRHNIADEEVKVLAREPNTWRRKINEAVEIRTHKQRQWI